MIFLDAVDNLDTPENNNNFQRCLKHKENPDKHLFLFLYMTNCIHCDDAKKSWSTIKDKLEPGYLEDDDIMLSQINHQLYDKKYELGDDPMGFPTLRYIHKNKVDEYNEGRETEDFVNWIKSKIKLRPNHKVTHQDVHTKKRRHHLMEGGRKTNKKRRRRSHKKRKRSHKKKRSHNRRTKRSRK
jgi:hypothetical protein